MTTMTAPAPRTGFGELFNNPYSIDASFQLSGKLIGSDRCQHIGRIRDGDSALRAGRFAEFLRAIKPVFAFLQPGQRRRIIERVVYNDLFLCPMEPVEFSLPIANGDGRFSFESQVSRHLEMSLSIGGLDRSLVRQLRQRFHNLYGTDISRSQLAIRYMKLDSAPHTSSGIPVDPATLDAHFRATNSNFLHMDEKKGVTTIVYLSDVCAASGAFRYVEGSHLAPVSPTLKAMHEFTYNDLKLSHAKDLLALPPEFRCGINYYYWLEPEKQRVIDGFVRTLEGRAGTGITFAGNMLLHGGGIPFTGERTALFVQHIGRFLHRARQLTHPISLLHRAGYAA